MMESLHDLLLPYKEEVGKLAGIVTIAQFFSGIFICRDIYNQGSTKGISSIPFVGGITIGVLNLKYGFLLQDEVMNVVNTAAIILNLLYLSFYFLYSNNTWGDIYKPGIYGALLVSVCLGYTEVESPDLLEYRYGLLVTVLMLLLMGSPLIDIKTIISSKDASSIPFPLTFMAAIVTFLWLLYGIILDNTFMVVQNVLGFLVCFVQLVLIFLYTPVPKENKEKTKKKK
ncbi:sugar transporter SWEET1-like [Coccinella septempunctata]|uniref:sugar transporter SWEET1-like n=1 Tax=Coccinella septempunctata TaxID=41139 RepID=UPI001D08CC0F|nr:sugar transporter SWEET1-like [Coccinella septempunctata]XP_044753680.1 sugar transporter SWEET1-like [Coccinella septempunctata]